MDGQSVSIKVAAYRDIMEYLKLSLLHQSANLTFPVLIDINNDDNLLLLGMNTDVIEILKTNQCLTSNVIKNKKGYLLQQI